MKQFILKLSLKETNIYRKISVKENVGFFELHDIIQIVFGWGNAHLHHFKIGRLVIGDYDNEDDIPPDYIYEGEANLSMILLNETEILYEYDFGDGWKIIIKLLEVKKESTERTAEVIESFGPMLADDCGGVENLESIAKVEADVKTLNFLLDEYYQNKN